MENNVIQNDIKRICKYLLEILEEILNKKAKISSFDFSKFLHLKKLEENNDFDTFFSNNYFDDLLSKYKINMQYIRKGVDNIKKSNSFDSDHLYMTIDESDKIAGETDEYSPTDLYVTTEMKKGGDEISFQFQSRQLFFDTLEKIEPYNLIEVFGPNFDEKTLDKLLISNDNDFLEWVNSQYNTTFKLPIHPKKYPTLANTLKEKINLLLKRENDIVI